METDRWIPPRGWKLVGFVLRGNQSPPELWRNQWNQQQDNQSFKHVWKNQRTAMLIILLLTTGVFLYSMPNARKLLICILNNAFRLSQWLSKILLWKKKSPLSWTLKWSSYVTLELTTVCTVGEIKVFLHLCRASRPISPFRVRVCNPREVQ